jgi:hypothetical protein
MICLKTLHRARGAACLAVLALGAACSGSDDDRTAQGRFATTSVVFADTGNSTYLSLLRSLDAQEIDYTGAREFPGWADVWLHEGKVFWADAEAPTLTRFAVDDQGALVEDGRLSFLNHGAKTAAFWTNMFVSATKAYLFVIESREVVIWNPQTMEITGSFPITGIEDRGRLTLQVPSTDRSSLVRGNRAYVPTHWANWDDYALSEDSIVLVIDTTTDAVINTLSVPCPNINVASRDDAGDIYLSNWVFSVASTLIHGKARACAVRMKAGSDQIDPQWSLTFADVTEGREAGALRFLGNGQALMSVFHHEKVEITPTTDPYALVEGANWRFWTIDVQSRKARPLDGIGWHSGGYYSTRIDGRNHLFVPTADYASTAALELASNGTVEPRWNALGWVTRLFRLR